MMSSFLWFLYTLSNIFRTNFYHYDHWSIFRSLVILPEMKVETTLEAEDLIPHIHEPNNWTTWLINFMYETSKPIVAVCAIIVFAAAYKAVNVLQILLKVKMAFALTESMKTFKPFNAQLPTKFTPEKFYICGVDLVCK